MAINQNFYTTLNSLVNYYTTSGTITGSIVNYSTFIDAGKVLGDPSFDIKDLTNNFLTPLMNKVQMTIDTYRAYEPELFDLYQGDDRGGLVEVIQHTFYKARKAEFVNLPQRYEESGVTKDKLVDGMIANDSMIDYVQTDIGVKYFIENNAWQVPISVTDTELRAAWTSPEAMAAFIERLLGDATNSVNLEREVARQNLLCAEMQDVETNGLAVTTNNGVGRNIKLITIYNSLQSTASSKVSTNPEQALQNTQFVRWCVSYIKQMQRMMTKPLAGFNGALTTGKRFKTFTPMRDQHLKIHSVFESAINRSLIDAYNEERSILQDYEVLAYWQYPQHQEAGGGAVSTLTVLKDGADPEETTSYTAPIVACLYDRFSLMEMRSLSNVSSERNNKKLYTTYYFNNMYKYIRNDSANFIVFTLA